MYIHIYIYISSRVWYVTAQLFWAPCTCFSCSAIGRRKLNHTNMRRSLRTIAGNCLSCELLTKKNINDHLV